MGFYEELRDSTAGPLIAQFGQAAQIRRYTQGAYNPATGSRATSTYIDHACYLVVSEYNEKAIDGTIIKQGDKQALISAQGLSITPAITDTVILSDGTWVIPDSPGAVKPLSPAGIPVIYTVRLRK
jgi:hypothetical protein